MLHVHLEVTAGNQSTRFVLAHHIKISVFIVYKENTKTWTFCWVSLPMSRASTPAFQSNNRGVILKRILPLLPQCTGQAGSLTQAVCVSTTVMQGQGTEPRCPGHILLPETSLHVLVLLPHQKDWASWKGQLPHSSVWFAGTKESPVKPLAAHPRGCRCIYSKSWSFQWFQLLLLVLGRTKPLWGWQGGHAGASVPAHFMEQGTGSCFRARPNLLSTWSCFRHNFMHLGEVT